MKLLKAISWGGKVAAAALLCLCLSACGTRITRENYEKITTGMTETEVHNILGSPTESMDMNAGGGFGGMNIQMDFKTSVWRQGRTVIMLTFQGGKVMSKMGFFEGEDPNIDLNKPQPNPGPNPNPFPWGNQPQGGQPNPNPNPNQIPNPGGGGDNPPENGGNDKVTKANFEKIQNGMTEPQVTAILGPASKSFPLGESRVLQWNDAKGMPLITIHTRNNQVVLKAAGFGLK